MPGDCFGGAVQFKYTGFWEDDEMLRDPEKVKYSEAGMSSHYWSKDF